MAFLADDGTANLVITVCGDRAVIVRRLGHRPYSESDDRVVWLERVTQHD